MKDYKGSIPLIGGLTQAGEGNFFLANTEQIQANENGDSLDRVISDLQESNTKGEAIALYKNSHAFKNVFDDIDGAEAVISKNGIFNKQNILDKTFFIKEVPIQLFIHNNIYGDKVFGSTDGQGVGYDYNIVNSMPYDNKYFLYNPHKHYTECNPLFLLLLHPKLEVSIYNRDLKDNNEIEYGEIPFSDINIINAEYKEDNTIVKINEDEDVKVIVTLHCKKDDYSSLNLEQDSNIEITYFLEYSYFQKNKSVGTVAYKPYTPKITTDTTSEEKEEDNTVRSIKDIHIPDIGFTYSNDMDGKHSILNPIIRNNLHYTDVSHDVLSLTDRYNIISRPLPLLHDRTNYYLAVDYKSLEDFVSSITKLKERGVHINGKHIIEYVQYNVDYSNSYRLAELVIHDENAYSILFSDYYKYNTESDETLFDFGENHYNNSVNSILIIHNSNTGSAEAINHYRISGYNNTYKALEVRSAVYFECPLPVVINNNRMVSTDSVYIYPKLHIYPTTLDNALLLYKDCFYFYSNPYINNSNKNSTYTIYAKYIGYDDEGSIMFKVTGHTVADETGYEKPVYFKTPIILFLKNSIGSLDFVKSSYPIEDIEYVDTPIEENKSASSLDDERITTIFNSIYND